MRDMWNKDELIREINAAYQAAKTQIEIIEARAYYQGVLRALNEYRLMCDSDYYEIRTLVRKLFLREMTKEE
jgi:hypothetical protein